MTGANVKRRRLPKAKTLADLMVGLGAFGLGVAAAVVALPLGLAVWSAAAIAAGLFLVDVEGRR